MQRDGAADRDAGERDLAGDAERVQQRRRGRPTMVSMLERAAHLLATARRRACRSAARAGCAESIGSDHVPALERAAHLVDQHEGGRAVAGKLVAQRGAVDLDEVHGVPQSGSAIGGATSARQSGAKVERRAGALLQLRLARSRRAFRAPGSRPA